MTHTVIHRHQFSPIEVALAFGLVEPGDNTVQISIMPGSGWLQVDVIDPGVTALEPPPATLPVNSQGSEPNSPGPDPETTVAPTAEPEKPKGGPLARRASLLCKEGAFRVWLEVGSEDEARNEICRRCLVGSRAELDHDGDAADKWNEIERRYRLWLDGYDE